MRRMQSLGSTLTPTPSRSGAASLRHLPAPSPPLPGLSADTLASLGRSCNPESGTTLIPHLRPEREAAMRRGVPLPAGDGTVDAAVHCTGPRPPRCTHGRPYSPLSRMADEGRWAQREESGSRVPACACYAHHQRPSTTGESRPPGHRLLRMGLPWGLPVAVPPQALLSRVLRGPRPRGEAGELPARFRDLPLGQPPPPHLTPLSPAPRGCFQYSPGRHLHCIPPGPSDQIPIYLLDFLISSRRRRQHEAVLSPGDCNLHTEALRSFSFSVFPLRFSRQARNTCERRRASLGRWLNYARRSFHILSVSARVLLPAAWLSGQAGSLLPVECR